MTMTLEPPTIPAALKRVQSLASAADHTWAFRDFVFHDKGKNWAASGHLMIGVKGEPMVINTTECFHVQEICMNVLEKEESKAFAPGTQKLWFAKSEMVKRLKEIKQEFREFMGDQFNRKLATYAQLYRHEYNGQILAGLDVTAQGDKASPFFLCCVNVDYLLWIIDGGRMKTFNVFYTGVEDSLFIDSKDRSAVLMPVRIRRSFNPIEWTRPHKKGKRSAVHRMNRTSSFRLRL